MILNLLIVLVSKEEDVNEIGILPFIVVVFIAITVLSINLLMKRIPLLLGIPRYDKYKPLDYRIALLFIGSVFVSITAGLGIVVALFWIYTLFPG